MPTGIPRTLAASLTVRSRRIVSFSTCRCSGESACSASATSTLRRRSSVFGVSWYQTDVQVGQNGQGNATVRGIFDAETFSVSPGGTTTFAPTHQYHLGLWFNDPSTPFNLGCEPTATSPVVTPFNGEQNAGIQVLNTAEFPDNAGPLSQVHR